MECNLPNFKSDCQEEPKSVYTGVRKSSWFSYIVQFFCADSYNDNRFFRKSITVADYGGLKFWQTRPREKSITFLFLNQIRWFFFIRQHLVHRLSGNKIRSFWISISTEMHTFRVLITHLSTCPGFTRKWRWKNSFFRYVV